MNIVGLGKGVTSATMHRFERLLLRGRVGVQTIFNIAGDYQPNPFTERLGRPDRRACRERFDAFAAKLPAGALSCIDIGCNIGYFTFRMAERGGVCLGIEMGRNEVSYARGLAALNDVSNVCFLQFEISSQNVLGLPRTDVIICMSVFHHWARKFGLDEATRIMDGLAQRCEFLVFESGQHNETDTRWAKQLSFMGMDSSAWIQNYLRERGFAAVIRLGEFSTTLSAVPRHLFLAQRQIERTPG